DLDDPEAIEEELLAHLGENISIQHGLQEFTLSVTPKTPNSHEVVLSVSCSKPTVELTYDVAPGQTSSYLETVVNQDSFETQQERSLGHPIAFAVSQAITQFTEDNSIQVQDFKGPYFGVDRSQEEELQGGYQRK